MNTSVYEYGNYLNFLHARVELMRQKPHWSLSRWSQELGLKSRSLLSMILSGERLPSPEVLAKFSEYFKLSEREAEYFKTLLLVEKYKSDREVRELLELKLNQLAPKKKRLTVLAEQAFKSISKWYYYTLRELSFIPNFRFDTGVIASSLNFAVSKHELEKALGDLENLGLLKRTGEHSYTPSDETVSIPGGRPSLAIRQFHAESLTNAQASLEKDPIERRHFGAVTMPLDYETYLKMTQMIEDFQREVLVKLNEKTPTESSDIYQLCIQLFPNTTFCSSKKGWKHEVH